MTTQDTTRRVVEGYFAAWTAKKVDGELTPCLKPRFSGPRLSH